MVNEAVLGKVKKNVMEISMSGLTPPEIMVLGQDFLINLEISEGKMKIFQSVLKQDEVFQAPSV